MKKICYLIFFIICINNFSFGKENLIYSAFGTYENDSVILRKDRYYTNGLQLSFVSRNFFDLEENNFLKNLFRIQQKQYHSFSFGMGQKIYTATDIKLVSPPDNDRPYAGYLYFFLNKNIKHENKVDSVGFSVALTGPASLGEWAQKKIHSLIGSPQPRGWHGQLKNELLFMATISRILKIKEVLDEKVDWSSFLKFSTNIGTPFTSISSLGEIRYGKNLRNDFLLTRIGTTSQGIEKINNSSGWYYFMNVGITAVAYNTFLDGNIGREKPNIAKNNFIYETTTGIALNINKYYVKTAIRYLSKEFREQNGGQVIFMLNFGMIDL